MLELSREGTITFKDLYTAWRRGTIEFNVSLERIRGWSIDFYFIIEKSYAKLGRCIDGLMKENLIDNFALARALKMSEDTIREYRTGQDLPSRNTRSRISRFFGKENNYLEDYI